MLASRLRAHLSFACLHTLICVNPINDEDDDIVQGCIVWVSDERVLLSLYYFRRLARVLHLRKSLALI